MSKDFDRLPSLPPALQQEAARLRAMKPSEDFDAQLRAALARADIDQARLEHARPRTGVPTWMRRAALFVPVAAGALLILHLGIESREDAYLQESNAVDVVLSEDGHTWVNLVIEAEHHKGTHATVHVEAPSTIEVIPTEHAIAGDAGPNCSQATCQYRFAHPNAHPDRHPVQLGIRSPGEYRIRVEHVSSEARVREDILVRARPDTAAE